MKVAQILVIENFGEYQINHLCESHESALNVSVKKTATLTAVNRQRF